MVVENRRFLRQSLFGAEGKDVNELHRQLLIDIANLRSHVGDSSNLILDPDLDSYYLMDTVLLKLPSTADQLVELRLMITVAAKRNFLRVEERSDAVRLAGLIESDAERTCDPLKVIYASTQARDMGARLSAPGTGFARRPVGCGGLEGG